MDAPIDARSNADPRLSAGRGAGPGDVDDRVATLRVVVSRPPPGSVNSLALSQPCLYVPLVRRSEIDAVRCLDDDSGSELGSTRVAGR